MTRASDAPATAAFPGPRRADVETPQIDPKAGIRGFTGLASVADFREAARRRLPQAIFDFVDGGAGDEHTLRANEAAFREYAFKPNVLTDMSHVDAGTTVFGRSIGLPVMLGPSGTQRLVNPQGELAAARAAARFRSIYCLTVAGSRSIEEVADAGRGAGLWFQLYLWKDRPWSEALLARAAAAGYEALVVTVDIKSPGGRKYRDIRNGITRMPDSLGTGTIVSALSHPRWLAGYLLHAPIRTVHVTDGGKGASIFRASTETWRRMDPGATWDEIRWLRRVWQGPLVVKGILTAEDAEKAFDAGADGVVCSNHGGRALDDSPASLRALPRVAEAAQRRGKEVFFDGGIRTGGDVVKALALGATSTFIARPFWWGLTVGGQEGVSAILRILYSEIQSTMTLLGRGTVAELEPDILEQVHP